MTDLTRNTRTLIVCFSLAIFALIPLRFVEIGQQIPEETVLGETQVFMEEPEVVLPVADEYVLGDLEAPYNEAVATNCMSQEQVDEAVARVNEGLTAGLYVNAAEADLEIQWLSAQICQ